MRLNIYTIILILGALLFSILANAADQIVNVAESTIYSVKNDILNNYQSRTVYLDRSSMQLYVSSISALATRERRQNQNIGVHKINIFDGMATDINLNNTQKDTLKISDIQCMLTTNGGDIFATITTESGKSIIVSIDIDGEIKLISKLASAISISKIISTTDNKLIFIGRKSMKSFIMKTDSKGNEIWNKVFDRGQHETFVDGIPTNDGDLILIENSGKFEQFYMGESSLFVTKFDANGNKIYERYLPGRYGHIAKGNVGSFAVVYDKKADSSQEIWVQAYDKDLSPLWSQKITNIKFGLERFKIAGLANGNYVVAGTVNGKPWVTYLDSEGTKKWDYLSTSQDFENSIDIVANGNDVYLVSTVIRLNADKALNNKIKLLKFQPK